MWDSCHQPDPDGSPQNIFHMIASMPKSAALPATAAATILYQSSPTVMIDRHRNNLSVLPAKRSNCADSPAAGPCGELQSRRVGRGQQG